MKNYLLFAYDRRYPSGGLNDLIGSFDTLKDASDAFFKENRIYGHVLCLQQLNIVELGYEDLDNDILTKLL